MSVPELRSDPMVVAPVETEEPAGVQATPSTPSTAARPRRDIAMWCAGGWLGALVFAAVFADVLPLHRYDGLAATLDPGSGPGLRWPEILGTDYLGRSSLSRMVHGARLSMFIAVGSVLLGGACGVIVGLAAGYLGGKVDAALTVLLDIVLAFPPLVLLLTIASVGGRNASTIVAALAVLVAPGMARVVRAKTMSLASREFVMAARGMGAGPARIMLREILPHLLPVMLALGFLLTGIMIIAEGGLSFLGLGVPPPSPTWGGMISDGRPYLHSKPYLIFVPSAFLVVTVVSFRTVGARLGRRFGVDLSNR